MGDVSKMLDILNLFSWFSKKKLSSNSNLSPSVRPAVYGTSLLPCEVPRDCISTLCPEHSHSEPDICRTSVAGNGACHCGLKLKGDPCHQVQRCQSGPRDSETHVHASLWVPVTHRSARYTPLYSSIMLRILTACIYQVACCNQSPWSSSNVLVHSKGFWWWCITLRSIFIIGFCILLRVILNYK
jgi:hypothetical protein